MSADRAATVLARFNATHSSFVAKLRDLPPGVAETRPSPEAWSPAQVACHVAMSNEWVSGVLTGATPGAQAAVPGFCEAFEPGLLPATEETFPDMVPSPHVSRETAFERLRTSNQHLMKAIASLPTERGSGWCVTTAFGTLSLFELADFAATHMTRHLAQVERRLAAKV